MKSTPHHPARLLFAALTLILLLSNAGCQMWVKRGAGQADLQTDQAACKAESGSTDNTAFSDCMTGKGWYNNAADSAANSSAATGSNAPSTAVDTPATAAASTAAGGLADKHPQATIGKADGSAPVPVATDPATPATPPPPAVVNSWWKLGGGPGELFSTRKQCEATTGDTPSDNRYSQAFIKCMKDHKWFAMR